MTNNIVPKSFVVISDFHSFEWPFDKVIDYYLNEYETIYILGDTLDRGYTRDGEGGIELLSKIMDLSKQYDKRIVYIPGNHDSFLYDYGKYNDGNAVVNMIRNGGRKTYEEFEQMKKNNPLKAQELLDWLGNLPLQIMHEFNGQKYALAHAFFNQSIYNNLPRFSLNNLYSAKNEIELYKYLLEIIWFRKGKSFYSSKDVPSSDTIIVIGHTPMLYREGQSLDLENINGELVKVYCVDGGIAYENRMLKYDGGNNPVDTVQGFHNNTSPKL